MIHGEDEDLAVHVSVCEQRYLTLAEKHEKIQEKFKEIDLKLGEISRQIDKNRLELVKIILASSVTLLSSIFGVVMVFLHNVKV